ncbi:DciA family protein [Zoogloea sp.]|uniref:DciA family protein n=1 Tax=Zoogloea sp. TaxID=49181 RepID=UPI00260DA7D6|nr:DciA family protein [Zoogloea sp.]MDD3353111.1 DciA family protein [Zoogloea sp.]
MSASSIDNFLGSGDALSRLQAHAGRLMRLQKLLAQLLPGYMADYCKVANLKGDELILHVESSGLAVKLRQAVPSLLADFGRAGVALKDIKVKVAVREYRPTPPPPPGRHVSDCTRHSLGHLAASLPEDSPLAQALQRFVKRAG